MRAWFSLVRNIIAKYGIYDDDIYNFDETGFAMGKISAEMVVTTSNRHGKPRAVQQANQEWVTVIQGIGSCGYSIPPYIIFAGKVHLDSWTYDSPLPPNWVITLTENGWTTNEKGLEWVKHFDFHTRSRTKGAYRLLILDGHESHHSVDFELHCKEHKIITLCMPAHSSHKLQPLDVGCFSPLKRAYGKEIEGLMRAHITHIAKEDFLPAFYKAYDAAMTKSNIQAGFRATGLVPYDPEYLISQLDTKLRTPTPPGSSAGLPPAWVPKTPNNPIEITSQSDYISNRIVRHQNSSPTTILSSIQQLKKGMMMMVHEQTLMRSDLAELREANDRLSRRRRTKKKQLQQGGTLTVDQAKDLKSQIDATEQLRVETSQNGGRTRRPETRARRCGICGEPGHNARTCQKVESTSEEEDST
ncbi:transposase [Colletotrichum incanum]|uniref:Transposase n=1 Tax=Colletotrichum incanum TaxID=1573173 RepID=A0A161Y3H1_COLIC|nr:transposase [Colletotrichum incanum]